MGFARLSSLALLEPVVQLCSSSALVRLLLHVGSATLCLALLGVLAPWWVCCSAFGFALGHCSVMFPLLSSVLSVGFADQASVFFCYKNHNAQTFLIVSFPISLGPSVGYDIYFQWDSTDKFSNKYLLGFSYE